MRLNVQYIPLNKIKPNLSNNITEHVKKLHTIMWDCMHIMVVKKGNDGNFTIVSGNDRLQYLKKHTKNKYAPCIIDERKWMTELKCCFRRVFNLHTSSENKNARLRHLSPKSIAIVRAFLKEEPHFKNLSFTQKVKVLYLAFRYKKTVIQSMKMMVSNLQKNKN
ncbi:hypothetical protein KUV80_14155 [Fictibacillus nanhaiensis]|uniref:hypothetical protein n=1 Tax=Fictibacillus nanhaiensis TaxID=742169 RepID=UPI001C97C82F|nr:hypothetical protein [Fictibacillus nanhaiensis]MBY6037811.1 hypothetical protein [Fictibacillus nanhaiensis]